MARTPVPVTTITRAGVAPPAQVTGDTVNNHEVVNDGGMWLEVDNADGAASHTLTVKFSRTVDGQAVTSRTYSLPASTTGRRIGPWPAVDYGTLMQVDVDSSQIKLRAWRLGV